MKKLLFLIFIPILSFSLSITIPEKIMSIGVQKAFPIEKTIAFNKVVLKDPILKMENDKINIEVLFETSLLSKEYSGKLFISTNVYYNEENGFLYLKDPKFDKYVINDVEYLPDDNLLFKGLLMGIYPILEFKPIFNTKEHKFTKFLNIKNVVIENNKLKVIF